MFNIQGLMKQAQMMQKRMKETQDKLALEEREGTSGGGLVKVVLNGKNEMKQISISSEIVNKDEIEVLEDMVMAAYNDAHQKINAMQEEGMKEATGGADFGGLKIPF
ncbi:MAG: YbaB/EbfC family nucleoid-associated protein [Alphaproteobacteria bacterium]|nr:YbaB/EbfC family nucleoid-associated protein [Alphaproteobacteria bacterium]